jgi:hypothetical protein
MRGSGSTFVSILLVYIMALVFLGVAFAMYYFAKSEPELTFTGSNKNYGSYGSDEDTYRGYEDNRYGYDGRRYRREF